jgi:hypothetical protein
VIHFQTLGMVGKALSSRLEFCLPVPKVCHRSSDRLSPLQYKFVLFFEEMASIFITPFLLWFYVPKVGAFLLTQ